MLGSPSFISFNTKLSSKFVYGKRNQDMDTKFSHYCEDRRASSVLVIIMF